MTRFVLGHVILSFDAATRLHHDEVQVALSRHATGDWGSVNAEQCRKNQLTLTLQATNRITSSFDASDGTSFVIITEPDQSYTLVRLMVDSLGQAA